MAKYIVTRDVTPEECFWLDETIQIGSTVYSYHGATYGCIDTGIAVTLIENETPFFEIPANAVKEDTNAK